MEGPVVKRKKRKRVSSEPPAPVVVQDRLAALGDDFMASIEGPPVPVRKSPRLRPVGSPRQGPSDGPAQRAVAGHKASAPAVSADGVQRSTKAEKKRRNRAAAKARREGKDAIDGLKPAAAAMVKTGVLESIETPKQPASGINAMFEAVKSAAQKPTAGASVIGPPRMSAAEKRRFMSGKVSDIRGQRQEPPKRRGGGHQSADPEEDEEFKKTLRDVLEFVTPQLGKRERQQYEEAKIRALGGTLDARQKMPYNLLKKQQKRHDERRAEKLEEEKQLGVSMSASSHRMGFEVDRLLKKKKEALKEKEHRKHENLNRLGGGAREVGGMATFSKSAIRNMQRYG